MAEQVGDVRLEEFFIRLVKFGKISMAECDYATGKYNGIPECCIRYYMRFQAFGIPASIATALVLGNDDADVKYVRCPKCRGIQSKAFNPTAFLPNKKALIAFLSAYYPI